MEKLLERCAGLDVHKKTVTACVRVPGVSGDRVQHVRTFATTTADLLVLRDWLEAHRVTHVAMERTRVYLGRSSTVLEEACTCILANAVHIAQVPGRKTDVNDAAWIAQLLEHGLIRPSFVPPAPFRELRDLTRYRKLLIQERTNQRTAEVLIAELGVDMKVFPTAKHAASWAGLCPGNHESAGKHRLGPDPPRQSLAPRGPDRGRAGGECPLHQGRFRRALSPRQGAPGPQASGGRRRPRHPRDRLPPLGSPDDLSGPGGRLLRSPPRRARPPPSHSHAGAPRLSASRSNPQLERGVR